MNSVKSNIPDSYLIFGKCLNKHAPEQIGGVIVLFEQLVSSLNHFGIRHEVIDLNYRNYGRKVVAIFSIYIALISKVFNHNKVMINGSNSVTLFLLPVALLVCWITRRKIILRVFGGHFDKFYYSKPFIVRSFLKFQLRKVDLVFFETKYLVDKFRLLNANTAWFPNVRMLSSEDIRLRGLVTKGEFNGKFVFLGHVKPEKGIIELIEAKNVLDENFNLHIYGPMGELKLSDKQKKTFESVYRGALKPNQVLPTLARYDVLILPTTWQNEGYPGVIIEALALNIPIITTSLPGITEMLTNDCVKFVSPGNTTQLIDAILFFNKANYSQYCQAAERSFEQFDAYKQMPRIFSIMDAI